MGNPPIVACMKADGLENSDGLDAAGGAGEVGADSTTAGVLGAVSDGAGALSVGVAGSAGFGTSAASAVFTGGAASTFSGFDDTTGFETSEEGSSAESSVPMLGAADATFALFGGATTGSGSSGTTGPRTTSGAFVSSSADVVVGALADGSLVAVVDDVVPQALSPKTATNATATRNAMTGNSQSLELPQLQ